MLEGTLKGWKVTIKDWKGPSKVGKDSQSLEGNLPSLEGDPQRLEGTLKGWKVTLKNWKTIFQGFSDPTFKSQQLGAVAMLTLGVNVCLLL